MSCVRYALQRQLFHLLTIVVTAYFEKDVDVDDVLAIVNKQLAELCEGVEFYHSAKLKDVLLQGALISLVVDGFDAPLLTGTLCANDFYVVIY